MADEISKADTFACVLRMRERMRYAGYDRDDHFKDHPAGWMDLFDAAEGKGYSATQTYFATFDC